MSTKERTKEREVHTVLGAGQIGYKLALELVALGKEVRLVRRGAAGSVHKGLTWHQGDILDEALMDKVCRDAAVVYHCINPTAYHRWHHDLPPLFEAIVGAVKRNNCKLVVLDNVYMYGHSHGQKFTEASPMNPCSKKGALRAKLAQRLMDMQKNKEIPIAIGRASDFFGPDTWNTATFSKNFYEMLKGGKKVSLFGNPDCLHSYSYTPDVARGLAVLGTHEQSWGEIWHLPVAFEGSTRALAELFSKESGQKLDIRLISKTMVRVAGIFSPAAKALVEMLYQFEEDFVVDDSKFRKAFGVEATDMGEAVKQSWTHNAVLEDQHGGGAQMRARPDEITASLMERSKRI